MQDNRPTAMRKGVGPFIYILFGSRYFVWHTTFRGPHWKNGADGPRFTRGFSDMNQAMASRHQHLWPKLVIVGPYLGNQKATYLDLQNGQKSWTLYCLHSLFWDIGPLFWALLEVQVNRRTLDWEVLGAFQELRRILMFMCFCHGLPNYPPLYYQGSSLIKPI